MILTREMSEPTEMLNPIVEHGVRPRFEFIKATIRDLLGGEPSEEQLRLTAWSIVGQILFYRFGRPVITRLYPPLKLDDAELERIADHITAFTLAALKGLRKEAP
jgi:TetR/AcrR family transcriptional regulator, regulator of cefoperazone and chloramphenicol sensitivity